MTVPNTNKEPHAGTAAQDARSLFEANLDLLTAINLEGTITDVNEGAIKATGIPRDKLVGATFSECFTEPEKAHEVYRQALSGASVIDHPLTFRNAAGRLTDVVCSATLYSGADGNPRGILATAHDITESLRTEQRFRTLVESAPDAMVLATQDGIILLVNKQTENIFGYGRDEILGQSVEIFVPSRYRSRHPGHRANFFAAPRPRPMGGGGDLWGVRKDGIEFPIEICLSPIASPLGLTVAATIRDVTVQKEAFQYARSLIEANLDPLVTISPEGKITDVNEASTKVTGVARTSLIGTDFSDYFTEPDQAREGYQQVFATGSVTDYPLTIRRTDGHLTDVLYNASLYKDLRGKVLGVFAAARDVTQQKKAAEERSRLAALVDSSMDAIIGKSIEGIVRSWNKGAERMFGYTAAEMIGLQISVVIPPHLREQEQEILDGLARGERVEPYETQRLRKSGEIFDVSLTISPVLDGQGVVIGTSKIARDITAQKSASQYARSLIEASLDPLVTINPAGTITDVNEGSIKVTGIARDRLIGTDFSNYFTEPAKAREGYQQVFSKGFVTDYPLTIRHRDGRLTNVLYNASVYKDVRGNVLGVFAAARDVTAQKRAEAEVAEQRAQDLERLAELEQFQKLTVGRELKMIELKKEIAALKKQLAEVGL